jgi:hypothetical protein
MRSMRTALRIAAFAVGLIGVVDALVINLIVSAFHAARTILGGSADPTHGFIGLMLCLIGLIGAVLVFRQQIISGVLLILAGIAFFLIVHWWALLASPQLIVAGVLAILDWQATREDASPFTRRPQSGRTAAPSA